jgi:hypothetical protein
MATLPREWHEFLASLLRHRVKFLLIGGHAVAAHGHPRYTKDFDVFVEPTARNAKRLGDALVDFGFPGYAKEWEWMAVEDRMVVLGRKPMQIDILTSVSGVSFARAWSSHIVVRFDKLRVPVIGLRALLANKRATGRLEDQRDVILLEEIIRAASRSRRKRPRPAAKRTRTPGKRRR